MSLPRFKSPCVRVDSFVYNALNVLEGGNGHRTTYKYASNRTEQRGVINTGIHRVQFGVGVDGRGRRGASIKRLLALISAMASSPAVFPRL